MNTPAYLSIMSFYTLFIIGGIYYYEDKVTKLNKDLDVLESDYDEVYRAFVKSNNQELDHDNKILQDQLKALKLENAELKATAGDWERAYRLSQPTQYESTAWHPSNFNSAYENKAYRDVGSIIELW